MAVTTNTQVPTLWTPHDVADFLQINRSTVSRMYTAGKLPAAHMIGNQQRWNRDEILEWYAAGCPDRATWDARKDSEAQAKAKGRKKR